MKKWQLGCSTALLLLNIFVHADAAEQTKPRLSKERMLLQTDFGDIVLAFYPDIAPGHVKQILKLARMGVYDTTHVSQTPSHLAQVSSAEDRLIPLTAEQKKAIHPLKAEFNPSIRHRVGMLSMSRWPDKPDSADTSFCILLQDAPQMDGKYTVIGEVEQGLDVVHEMVKAPRSETNWPLARITIYKAHVVESAEQLKRMKMKSATPYTALRAWNGVVRDSQPLHANKDRSFFATALVLMILLILAAIFFPRWAISLGLTNVLIGGFLIHLLLMPLAQQKKWLAVVLFIAALGIFKLMSRFERTR